MIKIHFSPETRRRRVLLLSGAVSALFALLTAAPSFARPEAPIKFEEELAPAAEQAHQSIAVDEAGNAAVIWEAESTVEPETWVAEVATRPAGGEWSAPKVLSPFAHGEEIGLPGDPVMPAQYDTAIAFGPDDEVIAVWGRDTGEGHQIEESTLPTFGGHWGSAEPLTRVDQESYAPTIAIGPEGLAIVAWGSNNTEAVEAVERPHGGSWSNPITFGKPASEEHAYTPTVKFDDLGDALMVWYGAHMSVSKEGIVSDYRPAGGSWQGEVAATPEASIVGEQTFAFDAAGDATMVYSFYTGSVYRSEVVELPHGGSWTSPTILDATGMSHPQVAVDAANDAVVDWQTYGDGDPLRVQATSRVAGGSWEPVTTLAAAATTSESNGLPSVTIAPDGSAMAIWYHYDEIHQNRIEFATMSATGDWSSGDPLSESGAVEPAMESNASGQSVGAWLRNGELETFIYDPVGPRLDGLNVPSTGVVGEPVEFEVEAHDIVHAGVEWDAGNGETGAGEVAGFVYEDPGTYTVTVSAENEFEKVSTETAEITITAAGGETPSGGETTVGGETPSGGETPKGEEAKTGGSTSTPSGSTSTSTPSSTPTTSAPAPAPAPAWVALAEVARDKASGNGDLVLKAPGKGTMTVSGPGVKTTTTKVAGKGASVKLALTPKGAFKQRLIGTHHRGWTTVTIVYTPANGGAPITATRRVRLVKR